MIRVTTSNGRINLALCSTESSRRIRLSSLLCVHWSSVISAWTAKLMLHMPPSLSDSQPLIHGNRAVPQDVHGGLSLVPLLNHARTDSAIHATCSRIAKTMN